MWVPCPFLCVYMWGEGVFVCVHEGGNVACVYGACRLRLCVRSGLRLHSSSLSRPPPHHHALPVEDAAGALVVSRAGAGCSGAPAHSRRSLGGAWPYWPCWAPIGGWGAFGSPGPGPGLPWCGRLPVEPAGLPPRHPGASTLWLSEVPSGSPLPFSGWRPRLSLRWFSWGSRAWGAPDVWGPGLFHACFMPCGMGLLFPTHTIKHLHGGTL